MIAAYIAFVLTTTAAGIGLYWLYNQCILAYHSLEWESIGKVVAVASTGLLLLLTNLDKVVLGIRSFSFKRLHQNILAFGILCRIRFAKTETLLRLARTLNGQCTQGHSHKIPSRQVRYIQNVTLLSQLNKRGMGADLAAQNILRQSLKQLA